MQQIIHILLKLIDIIFCHKYCYGYEISGYELQELCYCKVANILFSIENRVYKTEFG